MSSADIHTLEKRWGRILNRLRAEYGDTVFKSWLLPLSIESLNESVLHMSVPTAVLKDWVKKQYADRILSLWKSEGIGIQTLDITVNTVSHHNDVQDTNVISDTDTTKKIDPRYTFDTFMVNDTNALAFKAAQSIASGKAIFNPLYITGRVGLGKTHLMHAIIAHTRQHFPEKKAMYISAEKFMFKFIKAIRDHDTFAFKEEIRTADILLIDDFQFIAGKSTTQDEFLHCFNDFLSRDCAIIISADRLPSDLEDIDHQLQSRLSWGMVAEIGRPDTDLRFKILLNKARLAKYNIEDSVLKYMAENITSDIREIEGALNRVSASASLMETPITINMVNSTLKDILSSRSKNIDIPSIQKCVAKFFDIKTNDMKSARRTRAIAHPRQLAMYLAKQLTNASLPEIGRQFGGRDHTTILYAARKIEGQIKEDAEIRHTLEKIKQQLG